MFLNPKHLLTLFYLISFFTIALLVTLRTLVPKTQASWILT